MNNFPRYSFAFQPIVNVKTRAVVSYEALVRGPNGQSAAEVFNKVSLTDVHAFDEALRVSAIGLASRLDNVKGLNLNLLPGSLAKSETAVTSTIEAANRVGLPLHTLQIEINESEAMQDLKGFAARLDCYRNGGLQFAIDDFGATHADLNLLAEFQPDCIKLDTQLVREIHLRKHRQATVRGIQRTCSDLGIEVIVEGVESVAEYQWFRGEGLLLFQGYLFARPEFEAFASPYLPKEEVQSEPALAS